MKENGRISVLIAPLNWGLGHATRCIPIINELLKKGARVIVAANPAQKTLLKSEFAQLEFIDSPGYHIRYHSGFLLKWGLLFRIPSILRQIRRENRWLDKWLQHNHIDAVISDNRYGLYTRKCRCVFITHQLQIQSGVGFTFGRSSENDSPASVRPETEIAHRWPLAIGRWVDKRIRNLNYKFISKFTECWIPDLEGEWSSAGLLSHPRLSPSIPVKYIGTLSRFQSSEKKIKKNSLLIIISGPEPQRTEFENILFSQLAHSTMNTVLVRGLPGSDLPVPDIHQNLRIWNHLSSDVLGELLNHSEFIIARSGYSTIMDLLAVKRSAILIPTPGQTEQEYLGEYLHNKKWMLSVAQKNFNLQSSMNALKNAELELPDRPGSHLHDVIKEFLQELSQKQSKIP